MLITSGRLRVKFAKVWICFNWRNLEMNISCITVFFSMVFFTFVPFFRCGDLEQSNK